MPEIQSSDSTHLVVSTMQIIRLIPSVSFPDGEPIPVDARMEVNAVTTSEGETRYGQPHFTAQRNAILTDPERTQLLTLAGLVPPVVVDPPSLFQIGDTLTCTDGNWKENPEPDTFTYKWQRDGIDLPTADSRYVLTAGDIGLTFTCTVTATHQFGSTSVDSNDLIALDPAAADV
jgi:hypothetical protein